ncbi:Uncharacterised protein [Rodentibacter pneumotropicus]|uniref:Uncharacterized protein n=1 Tax=Rodentibacter pneumotropicus TaxID=758 RepID=A0A3S4Y478_9PAST|nr:Uncharacterised protein [Rodentibacter pneumotropicus]
MIDFSLIGSERKPRRAGKTAKEREKKIFKELPPKATKKRKSAVKIQKFFKKDKTEIRG